MRPQSLLTYSRHLHPGAWWLWAIGLAAAASRTQNPVPLLLILVIGGLVVSARRTTAPWATSYGAFLKLALLVIAIRIVFQALLSTGSQGPTVLFTLPSVPMPEDGGLKLGGQVTLEAVLRAFYEGLQLGVILCCVGAANALGSARRMLRYIPGALYEIGVACVIALTFAPQLVTDGHRIRASHRLRGRSTRGIGSLKRLAMPVLEGALERSVELAAAMDSRGYGRTVDHSPASRRGMTLLMFAGLLGVCVGVYGLLDGTTSEWFGLPMLIAGVLLAVAGIALGGRRGGRSRYRNDPWALPEWIATACGVVPAVAMFVNVGTAPEELYLSSVTMVPPVPVLACLGLLVAALPAFLTPRTPVDVPRRPAEVPAEVVS